MAIKPSDASLKINFDMIEKSEAKIFGQVIVDFKFLDNITLWSDVVSVSALEKRSCLAKIP